MRHAWLLPLVVLLQSCASRLPSACELTSAELTTLKASVTVFLEDRLGPKRARCDALSDVTMVVGGKCSIYVAPRLGDDCPQVFGGDYWVQFRTEALEPNDVVVVSR